MAAADVFINLPKVKTHKKVGVTLSLKNLVGINTGRNWLPHHTDGDTSNGGDQFPKPSIRGKSERWGVRNLERLTLTCPRLFAPIYRLVKNLAIPFYGHTKETIRTGNWFGNDTCWRMVEAGYQSLFALFGWTNFPTKVPKKYAPFWPTAWYLEMAEDPKRLIGLKPGFWLEALIQCWLIAVWLA